MFGASAGNNNSNSKNVNTKIRTFYSDTASLSMFYWNDNISLKISPMTGVDANGVRQYDFNRRANTALSQDKCMALALKVDEVIIPAINEVRNTGKLAKPVSTGTIVGLKKSAVMVEYKPDSTNAGKPSVYLTVYGNLSDDNKAASDSTYTYKFAKVTVIDGYNPETGASDKTEEIEGEFIFFMNKIRTAYDALGTAAHSSANNSPFSSNNNQSSGFNNSFTSSSSSNNYTAPMSGFDDSAPFPFGN